MFLFYMVKIPPRIDSSEIEQDQPEWLALVEAEARQNLAERDIEGVIEAITPWNPAWAALLRAEPTEVQREQLVQRAVRAWVHLYDLEVHTTQSILINGETCIVSGGVSDGTYPTEACYEMTFLLDGGFTVSGEC